ncbi:methyl-accepting chemotaxis protein [Pseudolabrys sp. FHR47]|uniref:methyl-accepting chemotaxis protein n=1 Tax=Pseudolabrys sp. FHR47 TaxID=2562284 RepID=UPI0010BF2C65|nr:HAMP domain-containing methyl-accepting chemotaxis protein [Pseudolabrys sp. FHR47]
MLRISAIRLPIAAKAMLLIGALGILSAAANWYSLRSLQDVDRLNDIVTHEIAPVRLILTESKIAAESLGLATYKMAAASDPETIREAVAERAGQYASAKHWLAGVIEAMPDRENDVRGMLRRLDVLNALADEVLAAINAGDNAKVRHLLEFRFDPAVVDATTSMNRLIDVLGGQMRVAIETAGEKRAATYDLLTIMLVAGTLGTILIAMLLAHRTVARPLRRLAFAMREIAQGRLDAPIDGLKRGDEVGTMARAVLVFRDNAVALKDAQEMRKRAREQAAVDKREALEQLARNFESKILSVAAALAHSASELDRSAQAMSEVADESGDHAGTAAVVAQETTEVAGTVAAAIEELSASMHDIDGQLTHASGAVLDASRRAEMAVTNVDSLTQAVSDIDKVVGMIQAIASQTNLLALNATIEAARAGEAGRGFAVVAQEVKSLATQTTQALANIRSKTESVAGIIGGVRTTTESIAQGIAGIRTVARAITEAVSVQSQATQKIAETVEGAAVRSRQVSQTVDGVNEFAARTRTGAVEIQHAAADLSRQAAALQVEAQDFIAGVRAA